MTSEAQEQLRRRIAATFPQEKDARHAPGSPGSVLEELLRIVKQRSVVGSLQLAGMTRYKRIRTSTAQIRVRFRVGQG